MEVSECFTWKVQGRCIQCSGNGQNIISYPDCAPKPKSYGFPGGRLPVLSETMELSETAGQQCSRSNIVSEQLCSEHAFSHKDCWKTEYENSSCFTSSSSFDAPANMSLSSRFILNRQKPGRWDMKSLATRNSLHPGCPFQSSWIQRLLPESISLGLDQSRKASVRTGDNGLIYFSSGRKAIQEPSSNGDFVKQSKGHPHENKDARVFPFDDRVRKDMLNGFGSSPCDTNYGASELPPVAEPEARICPIQLPIVESLLPGYSEKMNKRELPCPSMHAGSPAKPSDGTRQSNVRTSPAETREFGTLIKSSSSCLGLVAAGQSAGFIEVTPVSVPTKETSLGVREHYLGENMNITPMYAFGRTSISGGRDYYLNERGCWRLAHVSEAVPIDDQAESRNELDSEPRQTTLCVDDTLSTENSQSAGCKSFHLEDRHISVGSRDLQESSVKQSVGRKCGVSLEATENLQASPSKTEYLRYWESEISEPTAVSKSDACASADKENASDGEVLAISIVLPPPRKAAELSDQICDVKFVKRVLGGVMPSSCFQLKSCTSQRFQLDQLRSSACSFKDMLKKADVVETAPIEWPLPLAPAIKDSIKQLGGNSSRMASLPPELCANLLQRNKLAGTHCIHVISELRNRGEVRSAVDFMQPFSHAFEVDGFPKCDSASCWLLHQRVHTDDVRNSRATHCSVESASDAPSHEIEPAVSKDYQQQEISLVPGMAVLSRSEVGTGGKLAEDEKLECKYALDKKSKHNDWVVFPHMKHSVVRGDESGSKNSVLFQRLQNASSADLKLQTDSEILVRDASIDIGYLVKSSRPAAVGHFNLVKRQMHADGCTKMKNFEHEDVQSPVLGKRSRIEEQQVVGSFHTASDIMGLDANRTNIGLELCSRPKMWMQRWCTVTAVMKTQNSAILDKEFKMPIVNNGKPQDHKPFTYLRDSINQDSRAWWEMPEILVTTQTENHKRRYNVQHKMSMVVSGLNSEPIRKQYHVNRKKSHFMKRFFTPSAAAMAIIGTTARRINAEKPQKKGLFGVWSSPKDRTTQKLVSRDAAVNSGSSEPEFTTGFVLSSAEYPVTPSHVL